MKTILYIIRKELVQIARDKLMGKAIIAIPIIQMIVLVYAATFEIKNVNLLIVDRDGSSASANLSGKFLASAFFTVDMKAISNNEINEVLDCGEADIALIIKPGFERDFLNAGVPKVQLLIDAVNGSAGELALSYCMATISGYNIEIVSKEIGVDAAALSKIDISSRFWYNPYLDYKIYMAPGILVILITAIGWFMTGMNLVKEKESGTIEQLNVTPIKKYQFIAGKLIPFLIIGLLDLAFGLFLAWILYEVPFEGSLLTLFVFAFVYMIAVLGIGLFISTISNTQQQVLFVSFFFVLVFVLMSGLFTPLENMPQWGQVINWFNPLAYFSKVIRMVLLKGSTLTDISKEIAIMLVYGVVVNTLAIWRYRKVA